MSSSAPAAVISASKAGPSQVLLPTTTRSLGGESQKGVVSYFNLLLAYGFLGFFPLEWFKQRGFCPAGPSVKPKRSFPCS